MIRLPFVLLFSAFLFSAGVYGVIYWFVTGILTTDLDFDDRDAILHAARTEMQRLERGVDASPDAR